MKTITQDNHENHEKKAKIISVAFHAILMLILIFGMARSCDFEKPPTQEGILIAFGEIDAGGGEPEEGEPQEAPEQTVEETEAEPEPTPPEEVKPTPVPDPKPDVKTADSDEIALKKKKEEERKKQQEADKKKREAAEAAAEAKRKAAEAKAKAEAEAKAKADALKAKKDKLGGKFGNKPGEGEGSNSGNAGDPNATNAGSGTGSGQVGGGLSNAGVKSKPNPPTNPGVTGNAVIKICVDADGNVTSAEFTQKGSTITDGTAIKEAERNAKKWKFSIDNGVGGCGTITYKFEVK